MPSDLIDPSETALFDRLRGWAMAITNTETIKDHPGAPRPPGTYIMVNLISARRPRLAPCVVYEDVTIGGVERVEQRNAEEWEWVFSINVYAPNSIDRARRLISSTDVGSVAIDHLHPLAIQKVSGIRRLPEEVEGHWEDRSQFDLTATGIVLEGFLIDVVEEGRFVIVPGNRSDDGGPEIIGEFERP